MDDILENAACNDGRATVIRLSRLFLPMLTRRGFVKWGLVAVLPVIITVILSHPSLLDRHAFLYFMFYFSAISVFGISGMAASFLKRSNRVTLAVSAGAAFAYVCGIWVLVISLPLH